MRRVGVAAAFLVGLFLSFSLGGSAHSQTQHSPALGSLQAGVDCQEILGTWLAEEDPFENLLNPVLTSKAEVDERVSFYSEVLDCLYELDPVQYKDLRSYIENFLILVGGVGQRISRIDLAATTDPAIVRLRDEIGLTPPKGYVYINYFESRYELPRQLAWTFKNPQAAAVTLPCRFIIILENEGSPPDQEELFPGRSGINKLGVGRATSHELVHAYLLARLGTEKYLPKWFHEAVAVYLTEGAEKLSVSYTIEFVTKENIKYVTEETVSSVAPEEYKKYDTIFRYLLSTLGEQEFNATIEGAIEKGSVDGIFLKTGSSDYNDLSDKAQGWEDAEAREELIRNILIGGGLSIGIIVGIFVIFVGLRLISP